MAAVRLDKWISDSMGISRSEAREWIRQGRVTVALCPERNPARRLEPERDLVSVEGKPLTYSPYVYLMMNKPDGVVCATTDRTEKTVLDLLSPPYVGRGLFPVGRLDKDTTGLLILTSDGDFAHRVISPSRHVPKRYLALTEGTPNEFDVEAFAGGLTLGDGTVCLPAGLELIGEGTCIVTITEGQYHQVKRMLASRGKPVKALKRLSIGALVLDDSLEPGAYKALTEEEREQIFRPVNL